ncbi:MAG: ECF transporter S component [Ruminococcus sp.]|nr:ECF transporter S component [Ruminococcus sp.]
MNKNNTRNALQHNKTTSLVLLGLLCAIMIILSCTPLGYLNVGMLAITFNVIPVAIAAIVLGPKGGGVIGALFGITSFLQCIGIGGSSALGVICFEINPIFAFIQRFVPRLLVGILLGFIYNFLSKKIKRQSVVCAVIGFLAAFLNTVFFMTALVLLYGNTPELQGMIAGQNIFVWICTFVGINAVFEMIASTLITTPIGTALLKLKGLKS